MKITKKLLKENKSKEVLLSGEYIDAPPATNETISHLYINGHDGSQQGKWVLSVGFIGDWAVYLEPVWNRSWLKENPISLDDQDWSLERIAKHGDKLHNIDYIKKLVDVDEETMELYRH